MVNENRNRNVRLRGDQNDWLRIFKSQANGLVRVRVVVSKYMDKCRVRVRGGSMGSGVRVKVRVVQD